MRYSIFQKVVVNQPRHESASFNTLPECAHWLTQDAHNYVVVDTGTDEWYDGGALLRSDSNLRSLLSYSL